MGQNISKIMDVKVSIVGSVLRIVPIALINDSVVIDNVVEYKCSTTVEAEIHAVSLKSITKLGIMFKGEYTLMDIYYDIYKVGLPSSEEIKYSVLKGIFVSLKCCIVDYEAVISRLDEMFASSSAAQSLLELIDKKSGKLYKSITLDYSEIQKEYGIEEEPESSIDVVEVKNSSKSEPQEEKIPDENSSEEDINSYLDKL